MAKFCGIIGFVNQEEVTPGNWQEISTERKYKGDLLRNRRRLQSADQLIDNLTISNEISIVADIYAQQNFHSIRYVELGGTKWRVTSIDVQYPRLILEVGGVYNAPN